jgi:transposase
MQQPVEIAVDEPEQVVARVAAIDVAKGSGMVCTRVPHETVPGRRTTKVWEVESTTAALAELADHLVCQGIERVVLESTSDYWRPFFYLLAARGLPQVWLVNAAQVKNVPGRPKTDKLDAVWLAKLAEKSMVSPSFVPDEPMRHVRDLARARFDLVEDRARVKQRVEKLLEDALIKISAVLTDVHGVTGRAIIEALIAGQRNPKVLAELARGRARARRVELQEACSGRFTDHHARLARLLDQIDQLGGHIEAVTALLDEAIAALPTPASTHTAESTAPSGPVNTGPAGYAGAVERLCQIPGVGPDSARAVIGEVGLDMSIFGTARRLCSWAKVSPALWNRAARRPGQNRQGQPLPQGRARPDGGGRGQDRHLPRPTLPAADQTDAQGQSAGRAGTIHPGDHLPSPGRPHRRVHRTRPRLLHPPPRPHPAH